MSKKVDGVRPASVNRSLGAPRVDLTTDVWLAADLSMTLCNVVHKPAHLSLADGDAWRRRAAALDGGFLGAIDRYAKEVWINLLGLPFDVPAARSAAGFVETVGSMEPDELVRYLVGYFRRVFRRETPAEVMDAAIAGDRAAKREFRRTSFTDEGWADCLRHLLGADPAAIQAELAGLLGRWHREVYQALETEVETALRGSLAAFRASAEGRSLSATVELAAPGVTFIPEAGQTSIVLVPSIAIRPLWAVTDHRAAQVFAFPAPARQDERPAPPSRLVALGKAIGDGTRLRILRELATEPATPPDLAERMRMPRTTLLHHLRILRAADLIAVKVNDANYHQYHVRDEHFGEIERLLEDYLG
ncbi:MAG TPA: metalloregulator ArsR/SmtB family transcription factor [Candidatus Limnocylindrales bacterium]|nr:metalloregulator ArsR/SmtB family transcription factor [Candidatus Limnocylindrales bacterium]